MPIRHLIANTHDTLTAARASARAARHHPKPLTTARVPFTPNDSAPPGLRPNRHTQTVTEGGTVGSLPL
jgi:hypothetical protein